MKRIFLSSWLVLTAVSLHAANDTGSIYPIENDSNPRLSGPLFSDPIAYKKGDFVTIIVNLANTANRSQELDTRKRSDINTGSITSDLIPDEVSRNLAFGLTGNDIQHRGGGTQTATENLTTTLSAIVTETLPNGTMRVEAKRIFTVNKERTEMVVTGVVRRQDIASNNTISSTQVADLQIKQTGTGSLTRATEKGWLTSIYEAINPF